MRRYATELVTHVDRRHAAVSRTRLLMLREKAVTSLLSLLLSIHHLRQYLKRVMLPLLVLLVLRRRSSPAPRLLEEVAEEE